LIQWNGELINQISFPVDAEAILRTPIRFQSDDIWAWEPEKHGVYSVRSAYRLIDKGRTNGGHQGAVGGSGNSCWSEIWNLKVPPKVKVFWWRVLHEFLPTRLVLHRKYIEPIANCEACGADSESIRHVLVECLVAKSFWEQTKRMTGVKLPPLHPASWAYDLIIGKVISEQAQTIILIGMYALWMQRNRNRHGEQIWPMKVAVQWAIDLAFDLQ